MIPQWISYVYGFEGPTSHVNTACSSSLSAIDMACRAIRENKCDAAIVGGAHLNLCPIVHKGYLNIGILCRNGQIRSFDANASGFVRSDGYALVFLQRERDAKRIYAKITHCKNSAVFDKEVGITAISSSLQEELMRDVYNEANIDPNSIYVIEAHSAGTMAGDPKEIMAIDNAYCKNRVSPLYVGSIKSSLGHTEACSGLTSLIKLILSMENNCLYPNLHFEKPLEEGVGIKEGRIRVVTDLVPWPKGGPKYAAINNLGIGGTGGVAIIERSSKTKGISYDKEVSFLVCVSGRTKEAVEYALHQISQAFDNEFIRLLHEVFSSQIDGHLYRGHVILSENGVCQGGVEFCVKTTPLHLFIGGLSFNTIKCARYLYKFATFKNALEKINQTLLPINVDITKVIFDENSLKDRFLFALSNILVQVAIVHLLKAISVHYVNVKGELVGNFVCAFANQSLSLEEVTTISVLLAEYLSKLPQERSSKADEKELLLYLQRAMKNHTRTLSVAEQVLDDDVSYNNTSWNGVILEIGTSLLSTKHYNVINLTDAQDLNSFLGVIAKLHSLGHYPHLAQLYPHVDWPVSSGTKMIAPLIRWNHEDTWTIPPNITYRRTSKSRTYPVVLNSDWDFLKGHVINDRNLIPATAYVVMAWEALSILTRQCMREMKISFKDVRIHQAQIFNGNDQMLFEVSVNVATRKFWITYMLDPICTGTYSLDDFSLDCCPMNNVVDDDSDVVLDNADIYKMLSLSGGDYSGAFRNLSSMNATKLRGEVGWQDNWVTFLDSMLQLSVLLNLSDNVMFVPICIGSIRINGPDHFQYVQAFGEKNVPVSVDKYTNIIRSGYVEIKGLIAKPVQKMTEPKLLLESYEFTPFEGKLSLENAIRVITQVFCENFDGYIIHVVEVMDDNTEPIARMVYQAIGGLMFQKCEIQLFSNFLMDFHDISVQRGDDFKYVSNASLIIWQQLFEKGGDITKVLRALNKNGMIVSREKLSGDVKRKAEQLKLHVVCTYDTNYEKIVLLRPKSHIAISNAITVSEKNLNWLPELQTALKDPHNVAIYSQNEKFSGLRGLASCLRWESVDKVKTFLIIDNAAPIFDAETEFYKNQLQKRLIANVFQNGKWGSYRHLQLEPPAKIRNDCVVGRFTAMGDFSTFQWEQRDLNRKPYIKIYYCGINVKDVMTARGNLSGIFFENKFDRNLSTCEFAGLDKYGNRVMGNLVGHSLRTFANLPVPFMVPVPNSWSLREAATVPIAYLTAIFSFVYIGQLKHGQSVLIHCGSGGVGLAALNIASYYHCQIFTTVSTEIKKQFIMDSFPHIPASHIGNSRDTSFETMVLKHTKGKGVDIILNSVSGGQLKASHCCLGPRGKFFEIGRFDALQHNTMELEALHKSQHYYSVILEKLLQKKDKTLLRISDSLCKGIEDGFVKPLKHTVFTADKVSDAFLHMSSDEYVGRNLVQVHSEDVHKITVDCAPRAEFKENMSYIIIGGLGGVALELTKWLIRRGAKNIILSSRKGPQTGYQRFLLETWKTSGARVFVTTLDVTTKEGCCKVINQAKTLGPLDGVFNLALVLRNGAIETLNRETFKEVLEPKASVTRNFDAATRKLWPNLRYFLIFSSFACGKGIKGQANYGMANSVAERICEERRRDGYFALAIQWGFIGKVGKVAESADGHLMPKIGRVGVQSIKSCLDTLGMLLLQNRPIVASAVMEHTRDGDNNTTGKLKNVMQHLLGITNFKTLDRSRTLVELGMDSLATSLMRQHLRNEYNLDISVKALTSMTVATLEQLIASYDPKTSEDTRSVEDTLEVLSWFDNVELESLTVESRLISIPSLIPEDVTGPYIFLIPGINGTRKSFESFKNRLNGHVFCFEFMNHGDDIVTNLAASALKLIKPYIKRNRNFMIIGYSFGGLVAMDLAHLCQREGYFGTLVFLEAFLDLSSPLLNQLTGISDYKQIRTLLRGGSLKSVLPWKVITKIWTKFLSSSLDKEVSEVLRGIQQSSKYNELFKEKIVHNVLERLSSAFYHQPKYEEIGFKVIIINCFHSSSDAIRNLHNELKNISKYPIEEFQVEGSHLTIVKNPKVYEIINTVIDNCNMFVCYLY